MPTSPTSIESTAARPGKGKMAWMDVPWLDQRADQADLVGIVGRITSAARPGATWRVIISFLAEVRLPDPVADLGRRPLMGPVAWCCDSRYEECTKNPNQINICVAIIQKVPNPLSGFALGTPGASAATAVDSQFTSTASSSATTSSSSRTSSSPASAAGTSISPTATPTPEASKRNSLSGGAIAGATIGALIGAALIGLGAFWLGKHFTERKNRQTVKSQHQVGENPLAVEAPPHDSHRHGSYDHGPYQKRFTPEPIREIGEPTVRPSELAAPPSAYKR